MTRVLHLLGRRPDYQTEKAVAALCRAQQDHCRHEVREAGVGGSQHKFAAAVLGLRGGGFDVIHAWDERALAGAALAANCPILFTPSIFLSPRGLRWLRAVMSYRDVQVICSTATQHRACVGRGIAPERCHIIRPGVTFGSVRGRRDPAVRQALGFHEDDYVLLAPGESNRPAAHLDAVWAASILHVLDPRYKILLWDRGEQIDAAERLAKRLDQHKLLCRAEQHLGRKMQFEELLPATDAVLITAAGPVPTLPIVTCMAAALPLIARVTYTMSELLEDRHTAVMVPHRTPRLMAQRVIELRNDAGLRRQIADRARTEAFEFFAMTRFIEQHEQAYHQAADRKPVQVTGSPGIRLAPERHQVTAD